MRGYEKVIADTARRFGISISRISSQAALPVEASETDADIIDSVSPFTMTSRERLWALISAVRYLERAGIAGAFVECGVWRGGSVMTMAYTLLESGNSSRQLWLYDTYSGMTPPTEVDIAADTGVSAESLLERTPVADGDNVWCVASLTDVRSNVMSTGYPEDRFVFVEGPVEETLSESSPDTVALLRLDTDWYESTRASLEHLYPRLAPGGVCILDDYGHWKGARKAVDDFFSEQHIRPLMMPIDFSGRIFIKPHEGSRSQSS